MPYVSATLAVTPSDELTARVIAALTDLTVEILGKERARTTVVVQYVPAGQWARGGVPLTVRGYFVEVKVTAGTELRETRRAMSAKSTAPCNRCSARHRATSRSKSSPPTRGAMRRNAGGPLRSGHAVRKTRSGYRVIQWHWFRGGSILPRGRVERGRQRPARRATAEGRRSARSRRSPGFGRRKHGRSSDG